MLETVGGVERLVDRGVEVVSGLPGDGVNGVVEGVRRYADEIRPFRS